jgi:hypothetical protein
LSFVTPAVLAAAAAAGHFTNLPLSRHCAGFVAAGFAAGFVAAGFAAGLAAAFGAAAAVVTRASAATLARIIRIMHLSLFARAMLRGRRCDVMGSRVSRQYGLTAQVDTHSCRTRAAIAYKRIGNLSRSNPARAQKEWRSSHDSNS